MNNNIETLSISLFSEILTLDQLLRSKIAKGLPKGMELSHFVMLDYLSRQNRERSPAELARTFNLTKGALTNTLRKLEKYGYIHIRPDWDDARKKLVLISNAGDRARDESVLAITPVLESVMSKLDKNRLRDGLRFLRELREALD